MIDFEETLRGRRVVMTGHTGFTGGWLAEWLGELECQVWGYSLAPETIPDLFSIMGGGDRFAQSQIGDLCEYERLAAFMAEARPDIVFHLAAQPLVRRSFRDPIETFASNVMGTASVLNAACKAPSVKAFVCITTDKVYENNEWPHPYRENDRLGGKDPYSASKACAELVTRSFAQTLAPMSNGMRIATVRAGNIIGGGDWSEDRIVPDYYRAVSGKAPLVIRNPQAVRPWQHVLSACHGYMTVGAWLLGGGSSDDGELGWNIGPSDNQSLTVGEVIELLASHSPRPEIVLERSELKEANILKLDTSKSLSRLGLKSPWTTEDAIRMTAAWYGGYLADTAAGAGLLRQHLAEYRGALQR